MLEQLKAEVLQANLMLPQYNLVTFTWGNVSGIDRERGLMVIKPSGVKYANMTPEDMVVVDVTNGKVVEGKYNPSSDTPTHIKLYNACNEIFGIVHTHSTYATAWAQAHVDLPALGTTHADDFYGDIPCTRDLTESEINENYEASTGDVIIETFQSRNIKMMDIPSVLVASHGPFCWSSSPEKAVEKAVILEEVAKIAIFTNYINPSLHSIDRVLLDKHYKRKHGEFAYYGQK